MGAHRNEDFGNMINGTTGQVSTTCILKDVDSRALIDFAAVHNSNNDFALNGPQNIKANLRNYSIASIEKFFYRSRSQRKLW